MRVRSKATHEVFEWVRLMNLRNDQKSIAKWRLKTEKFTTRHHVPTHIDVPPPPHLSKATALNLSIAPPPSAS